MADESYRVTVKVRNANLLRAIERAGYVAGSKFTELVGIKYNDLNDLVNMKARPVDRNGDLKPSVEKLCVFLNRMPSELFDFDQMHNALASNCAEVEVDAQAMSALSGRSSSPQMQSMLDDVLSTLTNREEKVLRLRFGLDGSQMTLEEVGRVFDLSKDRVRQIECKALQKLRHPTRSGKIADALEIEE